MIGVDPSLSSTGVAVWTPQSDLVTRALTTRALPAGASIAARGDRIVGLVRRFVDIVEACDDITPGRVLLVIETKDFQTPREEGGHAHDRSGLWWQYVIAARVIAPVVVVGVTPSQLKVYATGDGRASKPAVRAAVQVRYGITCGTDDEADAAVLAAMALDAYGHPLVDVPLVCGRALRSVTWPVL